MADEELEEVPQSQLYFTYRFETRRKLIAGILIVIGIALSWVGSSQFTENTYTKSFNAPSFMMWFSTCWMMFSYLPVVVTCLSRRISILETYRSNQEIFGPSGLSPKTLFKFVMPFCVLWSATNYCYTRAISKVAVTDVTAMFASCNAFVYIFSLLILREPFLVLRVMSVVFSISGVVLMAYADGFKGASWEGVSLSLLSAVGAALYKVMFKRVFGDAKVGQVALFLTALGLFNLLMLWPIFEILFFTNVESITWNDIPWGYLTGRSVLGLLFNFLISFGIAFTFPLFISLGTILGIPINGIIDTIFRHQSFGGLKIGATFLIVGGFLLMLVPANFMDKFKVKSHSAENENLIT